MDSIHARRAFATSGLVAALATVVLGVPEVGAQSIQNFRENKDRAPVISAWKADSSSASPKTSPAQSGVSEGRLRFGQLLYRGSVDPWNPLKKTLLDNSALPDSGSGSGAKPVSPDVYDSDAVVELQPFPMDDEVPGARPSRDSSAEAMGPTLQLSENAGTFDIQPAAATGGRASGDSLDSAVPGAVRAPTKVEFSSADTEGSPRDRSDGSGGPTGVEDILTPPPGGSIPQIASPEPSVMALWGVSALLFASRFRSGPKS